MSIKNEEFKENIQFNKSIELKYTHYNSTQIGFYKELVKKYTEERAIECYNGLTKEKSSYILNLPEYMDMYSIRWKIESLEEKKNNPPKQSKQNKNIDYDYFEDEFYGNTNSVSYARWLYNRGQVYRLAKEYRINEKLAEYIGASDIPGYIKITDIKSQKDVDDIQEEIYRKNKKKNDVIIQNNSNLEEFREMNSRKIKLRLNKLLDNDYAYVIRKLIDAEEASIAAKNTYGKYVEYNYNKKSKYIREAIEKLKNTNLYYCWQEDKEYGMDYVFYVVLPTKEQVSWHGSNIDDMKNVIKNEKFEWDGKLASTLLKLINCLKYMCPSVFEEKFSIEKCKTELSRFISPC